MWLAEFRQWIFFYFYFLFSFFTGILQLRRVRLQFRQFRTFHPGASEKEKKKQQQKTKGKKQNEETNKNENEV